MIILAGAVVELADALRKNKTAQLTQIVEQLIGQPALTFDAWHRAYVAAFQPATPSPVAGDKLSTTSQRR